MYGHTIYRFTAPPAVLFLFCIIAIIFDPQSSDSFVGVLSGLFSSETKIAVTLFTGAIIWFGSGVLLTSIPHCILRLFSLSSKRHQGFTTFFDEPSKSPL